MSAVSPGGPPRAPKPFGYVPLGDGTVARRDPLFTQGHDRLVPGSLTGRLALRIVALSPVHVGTGTFERTARVLPDLAADAPLVYPCARVGGVPAVPGSTLKGTLRATVEAITASCLTVRGQATRLLPPPLHALRPCTRRDALCPACRLFGGLGYQSRIAIGDARLVEGTTAVARVPPRHAPRTGRGAAPAGRRFYGHGSPARGTIPIEVCPDGSAFAARLDFANLQPAELGLLLVALGQGEAALRFKLGGYKPACLGSVECRVTTLALDDPVERYLRFDAPPAAVPALDEAAEGADMPDGPDLAPYVAAAMESGAILSERLARLEGILRYPSGRDCPGEGY